MWWPALTSVADRGAAAVPYLQALAAASSVLHAQLQPIDIIASEVPAQVNDGVS